VADVTKNEEESMFGTQVDVVTMHGDRWRRRMTGDNAIFDDD